MYNPKTHYMKISKFALLLLLFVGWVGCKT